MYSVIDLYKATGTGETLLPTDTDFDFWDNVYGEASAVYDREFTRKFSHFKYFDFMQADTVADAREDFHSDIVSILTMNQKKYAEMYRVFLVEDEDDPITYNYDMVETTGKQKTTDTFGGTSFTTGQQTFTEGEQIDTKGLETFTKGAEELTYGATSATKGAMDMTYGATQTTKGSMDMTYGATSATKGQQTNTTGSQTITKGQQIDTIGGVTNTHNVAPFNSTTGQMDSSDVRTDQSNTEGQRIDTNGQREDTEGARTDTTNQHIDTEGQRVDSTIQHIDTEGSRTDTTLAHTDTEGQRIDTTSQRQDTKGQRQDTTGSRTDTTLQHVDTHENDEWTLTRKGNIGVQTAGDILRIHTEFWNETFKFMNMIFDDIAKELLMIGD